MPPEPPVTTAMPGPDGSGERFSSGDVVVISSSFHTKVGLWTYVYSMYTEFQRHTFPEKFLDGVVSSSMKRK
jgi:hypothetical protein